MLPCMSRMHYLNRHSHRPIMCNQICKPKHSIKTARCSKTDRRFSPKQEAPAGRQREPGSTTS